MRGHSFGTGHMDKDDVKIFEWTEDKHEYMSEKRRNTTRAKGKNNTKPIRKKEEKSAPRAGTHARFYNL